MSGTAYISEDGLYRYRLTRYIDGVVNLDDSTLVIIGLNPSRADESIDDPTIRRCRRFARDSGYRLLVMLNLFAFRTPYPQELLAAADAVGPDNDRVLLEEIPRAHRVIVAWGAGGNAAPERVAHVLAMIDDPYCLGTTALGQPRHPLYLPADTQPVPYRAAVATR